MDTVSLVAHGLSGIATFQETVAIRVLLFNLICSAILVGLLFVLIGVRVYIEAAITGWVWVMAGFVVLLCSQLVATLFSLVFSLTAGRTSMAFMPIRDYAIFVDRLEDLGRRSN